MSRVMELDEQIKRLQEEKSRIYAEERKIALSEIREKIAIFEFTPKELGLKLGKPGLGSADSSEKKTAKRGAKKGRGKGLSKPYKVSGMYFDLDGRKIPAGRGRPHRDVTAYAIERGVTVDSLKRHADGSSVVNK